MMRAVDLTGRTFGNLKVLKFDEDRHSSDICARREGRINKVRRYYVCMCEICGEIVSVRGENLLSGNTTSCGSCGVPRIRRGNEYHYDASADCYIGKASNTEAEFIIDSCDYETVSRWTWYETPHGYLMTRLNRDKQIFLHRYICSQISHLDAADVVDHIDRDTKNNRRCNLRVTTSVGNARNHSLSKRNTTGTIGVSYYKQGDKYRAYIQRDGKFLSLGYYDTLSDAIESRKRAEADIYGEFAPQI